VAAFQPYGMTEVNAMALAHDPTSRSRAARSPASGPPTASRRVVDPQTGQNQPVDREGEPAVAGS
jgi:hypothetical protein